MCIGPPANSLAYRSHDVFDGKPERRLCCADPAGARMLRVGLFSSYV